MLLIPLILLILFVTILGTAIYVYLRQKQAQFIFKDKYESTVIRYKGHNPTKRIMSFSLAILIIIGLLKFIFYVSVHGIYIYPKSARLQALENSVSTIELTTGREIAISLEDYKQGLITGGTYFPTVRIEYKPIYNHTTQEVYEEIGVVLKKNNWKEDNYYSPPHYHLQYGEYHIEIWRHINPDENTVFLYVE